jgi:hypothetical protein
MFDNMRGRGLAAGDKRQEALSAYLDNTLTTIERESFEAELARDPALRVEFEQLRALKYQMRNIPRRRVPRSFALDPAAYARPKSQPLLQLYPVLRGATALAAFFLIFTLALGAFQGEFQTATQAAVPPVIVSESLEESAPVVTAEDSLRLEGTASTPPVGRQGVPDEPQMEMAAEAAIEESAEGDMALLQDYPEALATLETAEISGAEIQPYEAPLEEPVASFDAPGAEIPEVIAPGETVPIAQPKSADILRVLQIGLAIAFLVLLILFWLARRQVRNI